MTKKKHNKTKTKIVYREKTPDTRYWEKESKDKLISEIKDLEEKKKQVPKGFRGGIQKLNINKAINDRRKMLSAARQTEYSKIKTYEIKQQIELQKAQNELGELRKKNSVDFSGFNLGNTTPKKPLTLSDLGL